jgi:hypothetical protein
MSGILVTPQVIIADSHVSYENGLRSRSSQKLVACPDGIVGTVGSCAAGEKFVAWYRKKETEPYPQFKEDNFNTLILTNDGEMHEYTHEGFVGRVEEPVWATGSAREILLGAAYAGGNLLIACAIAADLHLYFAFPLYWKLRDNANGGMLTSEAYLMQNVPLALEEVCALPSLVSPRHNGPYRALENGHARDDQHTDCRLAHRPRI